MKLSGNKVLITGGNKGIGLALAKKFIQSGSEVVIAGRNQADLKAVQKGFPTVDIVSADLTQQSGIDRLLLFVEQEHSDLNVLINNAGIQYNYDFATETDVMFKVEQEVKTNILAPIQLVSGLLPLLLQNKDAAIVNVSSGIGLVPKQSAPVYCGTKAGIHIFTKALRYQLEAQDIEVFEIIPPLVDTQMTKGRGKGKISAEQLAEECAKAFHKNQYEINIGKVKLLRLVNRLSPTLASRIMRRN